MTSHFDLPSSAKPTISREHLKTFSREELEQLLLSKMPLQSTNPSNTASYNPLLSSLNQSDHSLTERIQFGEKNISQKIDSLLKFTSDLSLLPNSSTYAHQSSNLLENSLSKNAPSKLISSNFDTVANLQKSNPSQDFQLTMKNGTRARNSVNPGNNNIVITDCGESLGANTERLGHRFTQSRRSVSPIFEKYGLSGKQSLQSSGNKNEIRGNDSFGMPCTNVVGGERDTFGGANESNSIGLTKSFKKDTNSSAIAGAMRALQEKLNEVENENKWLRESLHGKDDKGKENQGSGKKSSIEELKKEISKEKKKCQDLDLRSKKMETKTIELEIQVDKLTKEKAQTERKHKEKVKQLERKLQDTMDQLQMHSQELEVINEFCGKEKKSLKEALTAVRTKYRAKVDKFNTNIEALDKERKKLRMMVSIRDEENSHLKKKIALLETFLQNSIQNTQTDTSQVLEELKQINETMLVKAQKTSESLLTETYLLEKPEETFSKSLGITHRSPERTASKSPSRSTSASKQRLCSTLQNNGSNANLFSRKFSQSALSNTQGNNLNELKSSMKKRSKSPATGKKKSLKEGSAERKREFSASLASNKIKESSRNASPMKNSKNASPMKSSRRVLSSSARHVEDLLIEHKKPLTVHDLDSSPRFSRHSSPMKPVLATKKNSRSNSKTSKTKSLLGGL